ncbi:zinc-binding dehydrogenase [Nocardia sp. NPDC048505]|uniref:quinone oxidoreductase family protein n=1 Tax=unclassified Nocardia TaxID=2637762 RepID=UPI0033D3C96F
MKAIVMTATGGPEVLVAREVSAPRPGAGEVIVRAEAVPVLFPETKLRSGEFPSPVAPPAVFGFQAVGTVTEVGAGADPGLLGRRVGVDAQGGSYAEYVCAPAASATPLPEGLSAVDAAAVLMSGSVALALWEAAACAGSETVLIEAAATGVGAALTQLAEAHGAARVLATAGGPAKIAHARKLGADEVVDHTDPDWAARLREILGAATVDIVFDSIGGPSAAPLLDLMTPLRGRMLSYGYLSGAPAQLTAADLIFRGLTLVGCAGPHWLARVAQLRAAALTHAAAGTLAPRVEEILPLEQAAEAHRRLESRTPLGAFVLRP